MSNMPKMEKSIPVTPKKAIYRYMKKMPVKEGDENKSFALSTACLTRNSGTGYAGFLFPRKFRAKNCVLNPKLGDWEDIHIIWEIENRHMCEE